jgi:glutaminyl-tRNA synthetase
MRPNFITEIIDEDLLNNKYEGRVHTRFPPEPNGYLHIGHCKAIYLNFSIAEQYKGKCNLRFDDTNPVKEENEYVEAIKDDIRWLGFDWEDRLYFASDYFQQMYDFAIDLIKKGKAYVDDQTSEKIRETRGTLTEAGQESPYHNRTIEENLDLFERMKNGEFPNGEKVLRAKIDMASPNMNLRDPVMYRILHAEHHRTGNKWCIYPMYDWAHGLEDSIERITHSLCSLEFENHRPLYDWFLIQLETYRPQQIEFARLNINYMVMSKRKLLQLVQEKFVDGWDDPRMPTICGLRRRGYTPSAIREFIDKVGLAKRDSTVDFALLEHTIREELNQTAPRYFGVLKPLKVIIDNYPEGETEWLEAINNPEDESAGTRQLPFTKELFIEQDDFMENPPKKFFRLSPGKEVRLRYAYFIKCESVEKDEKDNIIALHCTYDPATKGGSAPDGRKVKATLHWVSAEHSINAEVRLYNHLFMSEKPEEKGGDFLENLNPDSLEILQNCKLEVNLKNATFEERYQFERMGYFCLDRKYASPENLIFNRTVTLKDTWVKIQENNQS